MAEEEKVPQGDSSSEETQKNKKKVIIGVCVVVALIVIFIIVLLLLLGSCTHRHTMIYHPAVEPTCDTPGSVQYWHCDECGNDYLDEKGHERIDDVTIDILPHVPVTDLGVAPGCESEGLTEGSHCATCGEVIVAQEVIPALLAGYDRLMRLHRELWERDMKRFGWEVLSLRYGAVTGRLLDVQDVLIRYLSGALNTIEELDAEPMTVPDLAA